MGSPRTVRSLCSVPVYGFRSTDAFAWTTEVAHTSCCRCLRSDQPCLVVTAHLGGLFGSPVVDARLHHCKDCLEAAFAALTARTDLFRALGYTTTTTTTTNAPSPDERWDYIRFSQEEETLTPRPASPTPTSASQDLLCTDEIL